MKKDSKATSENLDSEPHLTASKVQEFRKGNINFDFLQPGEESKKHEAFVPIEERRDNSRDGKRGLFNRGRTVNPVGRATMISWYLIFVCSVGGLVLSLFLGKSILQLLIIPMLSLATIGSLMMIALFKARPG